MLKHVFLTGKLVQLLAPSINHDLQMNIRYVPSNRNPSIRRPVPSHNYFYLLHAPCYRQYSLYESILQTIQQGALLLLVLGPGGVLLGIVDLHVCCVHLLIECRRPSRGHIAGAIAQQGAPNASRCSATQSIMRGDAKRSFPAA